MTSTQFDRGYREFQTSVASSIAARPTGAVNAGEGQEVHEYSPVGDGLRIFQTLAGLSGVILFVMGIVALFKVSFDAGFFKTTSGMGGFLFSPALAIAAIMLGGIIMATAFADQDGALTVVAGLVTIACGIAAIALDGPAIGEITVDRNTVSLFIALGAVSFVLALVPWWSGRQRVDYSDYR